MSQTILILAIFATIFILCYYAYRKNKKDKCCVPDESNDIIGDSWKNCECGCEDEVLPVDKCEDKPVEKQVEKVTETVELKTKKAHIDNTLKEIKEEAVKSKPKTVEKKIKTDKPVVKNKPAGVSKKTKKA